MEFMIVYEPTAAPPYAKIGNLAGFGRDIASQQLLGILRRKVTGQK
jgi:hypothetical protein